MARNLISGDVPTPTARGRPTSSTTSRRAGVTSVLAAVQVQTQLRAAVELRLPTAPRARRRRRSTCWSRSASATPSCPTPRPCARCSPAGSPDASDAVGDDVELLWAEESWVLATAPLDSTADRLQDLLADLAEVATALEQGQSAHT